MTQSSLCITMKTSNQQHLNSLNL